MTKAESKLFVSAPEAAFYLVTDTEAAENLSHQKIEILDDRSGVQARLDLNVLSKPHLFHEILTSGKVGSRWGKDLSVVYREYLQSKIDQIDETALLDEFEAQFGRYDADPYESAVLGEAMSIGIDLKRQVKKSLDDWGGNEFTQDDLAAAVGVVARSQGITGQETYGGVVFESDRPLSELQQRRPFARASQHLQQLLFMGLSVAIVAPSGGPSERETIERTFQSVSSFSIESIGNTEFDISDEVATAVDDWYDRLRYDVASNRVTNQVVRPASVMAHDLPDEPWSRHFRDATTIGLQGAYSESSFNRNRFENLWNERIKPHSNYDPFRSRHNSFPKVKVTRDCDEISRTFHLSHGGAAATPHVCGLPARTDEPEGELIDWIEMFLSAESITEPRWRDFVETFVDIGESLQVPSEALAEIALLHRERSRRSLCPFVVPTHLTQSSSESDAHDIYDDEWYEEHWSTVLSDFQITKQSGVGAIDRKCELQTELDPKQTADEALYYKLERDIQNAWDYYLDGVVGELRKSVTADRNLSIDSRETQSGQSLDVTVKPETGSDRTATVDILLPYSEVTVEGTRVPAATVTNTVSAVLDALGTGSRSLADPVPPEARPGLMYDLTKAYLEVTEFEPGELIYFDDIIEFSLSLPSVLAVFSTPEQDAASTIRDCLGSGEYIDRIQEGTVSFHRKGSDQHGSVRVNGDRYIAMELQEFLP